MNIHPSFRNADHGGQANGQGFQTAKHAKYAKISVSIVNRQHRSARARENRSRKSWRPPANLAGLLHKQDFR